MKVKSKISYLGERNSILPGQMAEQLAVEVDVKNVTYTHTQHGQAPLFGLDNQSPKIFKYQIQIIFGHSKFLNTKYE